MGTSFFSTFENTIGNESKLSRWSLQRAALFSVLFEPLCFVVLQ